MDTQKIKQIFFPNACKAIEDAKRSGNRFAYYTTAEVAYSVIKQKRMWMRSTTTMNDYMEVQYGRNLLLNAIKDKPGQALRAAVEGCHPGLFDEVWALVTAWLPGFMADTFISCVSKHRPDEDMLGRLSMWRAYGGKTGVALILNGDVFALETDALGAYASPVAYFDANQFFAEIEAIAASVFREKEYLSSLARDSVKGTLFTMFRFAVLCTKHPGFAEEQEWRVVASPALHQKSLLESDIAVVRGVPQPILKIPLENFPEHNIAGLAVPELLSRVIIGPCDFPNVTYRSLCAALRDSDVDRPEQVIFQSNIPLRHT